MGAFQVRKTGAVPLKLWINGVPAEEQAIRQLGRVARMPFVRKWVVGLPDMHFGIGATVGSVIVTKDAVIPAAVGVDIGCGMRATLTGLAAPAADSLLAIRTAIEKAVPTGPSFHSKIHRDSSRAWEALEVGYDGVTDALPETAHKNVRAQLGSLGGGNHFIEVCLDENNRVWVVIHSGSRGVGNRIGVQYIRRAKELCKKWHIKMEDPNLAYFPRDTETFSEYMSAVDWAQEYALVNRQLMMQLVLETLGAEVLESFDCHHNYINWENHYGENVMVTRKGAVSAREGEIGIIPGSMGTRSYIVRGLGNKESFNSCSHGAGRVMSRSEAKRRFTVEDHAKATEGIECRKDKGMLDETPGAYKDVESVMKAQKDLCEPIHTLRQLVCVKG